ncbi:Transcription factor, fungi [Penicillium expansum]|uniref:Transcription factor, fungi n=1 Tax=Penicillium expansum TaxID=27334 RepID=A0A0A2J7E7_PENEN|nr:Transcription factor, fungi [Penicillium expansum]KGO51347.1 Transcription factor, fungi [Penicillium expansum]
MATDRLCNSLQGAMTWNVERSCLRCHERKLHDTNTDMSAPTGDRTALTEGLLVKEGTSTRYVNELLFSRVLEKVSEPQDLFISRNLDLPVYEQESELQYAINTPASTNNSEASPMISFDGLISNPQLTVDALSLFPSRGQSTHLWQVYFNNVDVLLKVLHIPTTQPAVFAAINNPKTASQDLNALLFSIYFAAVTSLHQVDTLIIFGEDRQSVLKRFQRGLEVSLHSAAFLDSPTIVSLQAMSIYLLCHRNHNCGISGWTLNGILLRTAQWMGLHRDGERFNLSPLECEIRRRLWYQIIGCDARVGEDHALSTNGFSGFSNTKLPLNIDDRDISSSMEVAPTSKPHWTEMTLFLVAAEMNQALQQVSRLSVAVLNGDDKMTTLEQLLQSTTSRIKDRYLQHCDPNIPIQKSALLLGQVLMGKLSVFIRQQYLRGLSAEESASRATEQTLLLACDTIEVDNELKTGELLSNFHWLFSTFTQYHLLTYTLWHLRVRPGVHCADRAWQVVDKSFNLVEDPSWPSPGLKWNVLRKLREKAINIRISFSSSPFMSARTSNNLTVPEITGPPEDDIRGDAIPSSILGFEDAMGWNLDSICFPDWNPSGLWLAGQG